MLKEDKLNYLYVQSYSMKMKADVFRTRRNL